MLTLTMFSVITRCLGFIFKIYLSQIMTTTDLGIYNLSLSIYMVLITIVGATIPLTISKITANNLNNNKKEFTKYSVTSSLILTTSLAIMLSLLLIVSKDVITPIIGDIMGYYTIIALIPSIIFTALYSQIRGYLWGLENYFSVSMVEFIEQILRIIFCILIIILDIFPSPLIAVGSALSIACGISTLIGFIYYFKYDGRFKFKKGYYKEIISSSLPLTGVRLFGSLLQPLVAFIIPIELCKLGMSKSFALSEIGIVMGMTMPLLSIPSTIIGALCMIIIPKINCSNNEDLHSQISYYLKFTIVCVFIFIPIFIALGEPVCEFVFGNLTAGTYLKNCAITMLPLGLAQITTSILNALNKEKTTFVYYVISSIFMIASIFILPYFCQAKAMIWASGISTTILAILNIMKINKITNYKYNIINDFASHSLICIPIILLSKSLYNTLHVFLGTFLNLAITSIISVVFYFLFIFVFKLLDFKDIKKYVLKKKLSTTE